MRVRVGVFVRNFPAAAEKVALEAEGYPRVVVTRYSLVVPIKWLRSNIDHLDWTYNDGFWFTHENDAVMFKLRFG